jgi:IS5 family transposase
VRQRLGVEGVSIIDEEVFQLLKKAGVIKNDASLMDTTVLASNIIHPNDVSLIYKAFAKMEQFAKRHKIPLWWDQQYLKKRWRAFNLAKSSERNSYLWEFYLLWVPALETFRFYLETVRLKGKERFNMGGLLDLFDLFDEQTQQKLEGKKSIENRIVSLDEVDARPIKKGKKNPSCEFGSTVQMSFNRDGFMITTENFIGQPGDKTLYPATIELFRKRMGDYPDVSITDLGYRSEPNFDTAKGKIKHVFLGRSQDVCEEQQEFCLKARSATEGFIAVAKNWRGFGRSLYRGFKGDRVWTLLCQTAYNLKKFLQLYYKGEIEEASLVKLGLLSS